VSGENVTVFLPPTLPNIDRFSKFIYWRT